MPIPVSAVLCTSAEPNSRFHPIENSATEASVGSTVMPIDSAARRCIFLLHSSSPRTPAMSCVHPFRGHSRKMSQHNENAGPSSHKKRSQSSHARDALLPGKISSDDAIAHLHKTFPPLEFPADVAQRMTTHISWNRGVDGHNGRLGFVGRRVLHTYLLLFLHECFLSPRGYIPPKNAPVSPSSRLRHSALTTGRPIDSLSESYDDVSDRLLNTYVLGEYVGAAWQLERIMRWTPAIGELDAMGAASPQAVLRSSGLYKVRGATVEGVIGGIFHQFGGAIAHRVFHTRVLPHIAHLGLPVSLRECAEAACERLGGREGLLTKLSLSESERENSHERPSHRKSQESILNDDRLADDTLDGREGMEFTKVNIQQRSRERQKLGYVG